MSQEFSLQVFFLWIIFPQAPENNIKVISNFFDNSWRYLKAKVHHWYQQHRWQICHRCQRYLSQICRRCQCQWQLWQIDTGANITGGKFANGVNFSELRFFPFSAGVNDTSGAPWLLLHNGGFCNNCTSKRCLHIYFAFPNKYTIKHPCHTTASWKAAWKFMKTTSLCRSLSCLEKNKLFTILY